MSSKLRSFPPQMSLIGARQPGVVHKNVRIFIAPSSPCPMCPQWTMTSYPATFIQQTSFAYDVTNEEATILEAKPLDCQLSTIKLSPLPELLEYHCQLMSLLQAQTVSPCGPVVCTRCGVNCHSSHYTGIPLSLSAHDCVSSCYV